MSRRPAHVSPDSGGVRAGRSLFFKNAIEFPLFCTHKTLNDPLLMLKRIDLFMKVFICPFLAVEEAAGEMPQKSKTEAVLFPHLP